MDKLIQQTRERWNALANANVMHSIPFYDYTVDQAKTYAYRHDIIQDAKGKDVLCLASGGGQDSAAFGILGANVSVLDLSDVMLERDRMAAAHHKFSIQTVQGTMTDLSAFSDDSFDIVWQSISLNYCPDVTPVFQEVRRVLRNSGIYRVAIQNPFGTAISSDWTGKGYLLRGRYLDGEDVTYYQPVWTVDQEDGSKVDIDTPHLFRHNLSTVLNQLARRNFTLLHLQEWIREGQNPEPGSWVHFTQCSPLFLDLFWQLTSDNP